MTEQEQDQAEFAKLIGDLEELADEGYGTCLLASMELERLRGDYNRVCNNFDVLHAEAKQQRADLARLQAANKARESQVAILEKKNSTSLANNLCSDHRDKQAGKPCLACTIETLERRYTALRSLVVEYLEAWDAMQEAATNKGIGTEEFMAVLQRVEPTFSALRAAVAGKELD